MLWARWLANQVASADRHAVGDAERYFGGYRHLAGFLSQASDIATRYCAMAAMGYSFVRSLPVNRTSAVMAILLQGRVRLIIPVWARLNRYGVMSVEATLTSLSLFILRRREQKQTAGFSAWGRRDNAGVAHG